MFNHHVEILLKEEGGYVNDPDDPGGETNFGISKRSYPNIDIKNLTVDKAKQIYFKDFWLKFKLDTIKSEAISLQLLLMFVNLSPTSASICVQRALTSVGQNIKVDGVFGSQTIAAINSSPQLLLSDRIRIELIKFYRGRVILNKTQLKNLSGWIGRALL